MSFRRHSGDEHRVRTVLESVSPRDDALLDPLSSFFLPGRSHVDSTFSGSTSKGGAIAQVNSFMDSSEVEATRTDPSRAARANVNGIWFIAI